MTARQGVAGIDRKCRSCSRWNFFKPDSNSRFCPDCGAEYGTPVLGLDVTRFRTPVRKSPKLPGQTEAVKIRKPRRGEFRA